MHAKFHGPIFFRRWEIHNRTKNDKLEMWANAQRDPTLPNIGGALCSTPQSLADAHYYSAVR